MILAGTDAAALADAQKYIDNGTCKGNCNFDQWQWIWHEIGNPAWTAVQGDAALNAGVVSDRTLPISYDTYKQMLQAAGLIPSTVPAAGATQPSPATGGASAAAPATVAFGLTMTEILAIAAGIGVALYLILEK